MLHVCGDEEEMVWNGALSVNEKKKTKKKEMFVFLPPIPSSFLTSHHTLSPLLPSSPHGLIDSREKRGGCFVWRGRRTSPPTTTGGEKTHNTEIEKGVEGMYWEDNSTLSGDYSLAEDMSVYVCTEE